MKIDLTSRYRACSSCVCAFLLYFLGSSAGRAITVSVDFSGEYSAPFLGPAEIAGVVPAANWNGFAGRSGSPAVQLLDESGDPTTITLVSYFSNNDVQRALPSDPPTVQKLFAGYVDSPNNGGVGFEISGITFASYDLYVYVTADQPGRRGFVSTTEAGTPDYYYVTAGPVPTSYIPIASTSSATYTNANYARFEGLTDSAQVVTLSGLNSWSGIAGFQVVDTSIPEPGLASFAGVAGLLMMGFRRRLPRS